MPDPKRIPVYKMKEPDEGLTILMSIAALRARGWGYEDIAVKLGLHRNCIRPFIIVKRRT